MSNGMWQFYETRFGAVHTTHFGGFMRHACGRTFHSILTLLIIPMVDTPLSSSTGIVRIPPQRVRTNPIGPFRGDTVPSSCRGHSRRGTETHLPERGAQNEWLFGVNFLALYICAAVSAVIRLMRRLVLLLAEILAAFVFQTIPLCRVITWRRRGAEKYVNLLTSPPAPSPRSQGVPKHGHRCHPGAKVARAEGESDRQGAPTSKIQWLRVCLHVAIGCIPSAHFIGFHLVSCSLSLGACGLSARKTVMGVDFRSPLHPTGTRTRVVHKPAATIA